MNNISKKQVLENQLERLAAQRQLYSDSKMVLALHIVLSVPIVILLSLLASIFPVIKAYVALWGIIIAFLDIILFTPLEESLQQKAAKIQELFDCDILEIEWNKTKVGNYPDPELVIYAAKKYQNKNKSYSDLINWYPPSVENLPLHLARLVCQRANCWWDADLRRRFANYLILLLLFMSIVITLLGLVGGFTLDNFILAVITPLLPSVLLGARQYSKHRKASLLLDRLKVEVNNYWEKGLSGKLTLGELDVLSRNLQNEIYENRSKNPLIFDWIFKLLRRNHEDEMNKGADVLVKEALSKLNSK